MSLEVRRAGPRQEAGPDKIATLSLDPGACETAYDRLCDALRRAGKAVRITAPGKAMAQCPGHEDREASLGIWRKPGKVKIKCFRGCDDALDILPVIGWTVRDLFDNPSKGQGSYRPNLRIQARIEARRGMGPVERALDDLLQLPDIGMRLCLCIQAEEQRRQSD